MPIINSKPINFGQTLQKTHLYFKNLIIFIFISLYSHLLYLLKTKKKLWIGTPTNGPLEIYHGVSHGNKNETESIGVACAILRAGAIVPNEYKVFRESPFFKVRAIVFEYYIAELLMQDGNEIPGSGRIDLKSYALTKIKELYPLMQASGVTFTEAQIINFINDGIILLDYELGHTNGTGRNLTNWFSKSINREHYGRYVCFKFELSRSQVKELNKTNAGGNFFYENGDIICHQPLFLTYCTEIMVNASIPISEYDRLLEDLNDYNKRTGNHLKITLWFPPKHPAVCGGSGDFRGPPSLALTTAAAIRQGEAHTCLWTTGTV